MNSEVEETNILEKLKWEIPKLICLDKAKTKGGPNADTESYSGDIS